MNKKPIVSNNFQTFSVLSKLHNSQQQYVYKSMRSKEKFNN